MITTYSYLDQYKQIGLGNPLDYFMQTVIEETPFPLTIVLSESVEYEVTLTDANALSHTLYPGLGLYPALDLYPTDGINLIVTLSAGGE